MDKTFHSCMVPLCFNSLRRNPEKLFISVPSKLEIRNKWLEISGRDVKEFSSKSHLYICEDHFNSPSDMENYIQYKIMGSVKRIRMKDGCFPSKFECQGRSTRIQQSTCSPSFLKGRRLSEVEESLKVLDYPTAQTSTSVKTQDAEDTGSVFPEEKLTEPSTSKSVQVNIRKKFRSESTQCITKLKSTAVSPIKVTSTASISTSPFKVQLLKENLSIEGSVRKYLKFEFEKETESDSESLLQMPSTSGDSSSYQLSEMTSDCSAKETESIIEEQETAQLSLENTLRLVRKKPRFYIGITEECYFLINILQKHSNISETHILLCLRKIRLNTTFSELGDLFGVSTSYASKIFMKTIPRLSTILRSFMPKVTNSSIKWNLPIAFRCKYSSVTCIIDCLEIEIQKPSKAVNQALTWSEYKKANTLKYLISCTLDGLINYISPGYGGRISDVLLVEDCNFLATLPPGACILADRGFKHVEELLLQQGFRLLRPPSVVTGSKLSKAHVRQTKEIASIRIHIERVIRRIREFLMLKPHSVINSNLISITDDIITIACGLVNLQGPIIK